MNFIKKIQNIIVILTFIGLLAPAFIYIYKQIENFNESFSLIKSNNKRLTTITKALTSCTCYRDSLSEYDRMTIELELMRNNIESKHKVELSKSFNVPVKLDMSFNSMLNNFSKSNNIVETVDQ